MDDARSRRWARRRPPAELCSAIPGGASRETWLVEAGERAIRPRRDPPGAGSLAAQVQEFGLIRRASRPGFRCPSRSPRARGGGLGRRGSDGSCRRDLGRTARAASPMSSPPRGRLPGQLGRGARADPSRSIRRPGCRPAEPGSGSRQIEHWERELDRDRRAAAGGRAGPALAARQSPRAAPSRRSRPRRLPARQLHRRRAAGWRR